MLFSVGTIKKPDTQYVLIFTMKKKLPAFKKRSSGLFYLLFLPFLFASQFAVAQNLQIKGKVTASNDNAVLTGVSVTVKGTNTGVATDADGNYSISAASNATLVFSFIGSTTREEAVGARTIINVKLTPDTKTLEQVVVVGYGTQKRKDLTGSVSSVTAEQIEKVPVTTVDQALQGRSPGVQVTNNDGSPGAGIQVQIRGIGGFGDNNPLYVVDGYPITGGLNTLNPNDIATMDILKDASATAIYGNRAANGVVIITTKRGKQGGVQVSVDALTSIQSLPKTYNVLDARQFAALGVERAGPDAFQAQPEWSNPSSLQNIDWQNELYQTGLKQNYNVALRGGSDKLQSAFSAGYFDQKGIVKESFFKRYNASLNVDYEPYKWLKSSSNLKYTRGDNKVAFGTGGQNAGLGIGTLTKLVPTITGNPLTNSVKDANGNYGYYDATNQFISYLANPLYAIETQDQKNVTNYFLGSTSLEATLLPGLKLKTNFGINSSDYSGFYFTPSDTRGAPVRVSAQSFYSQSANNTFEYLWENTLSYSKTFGDHNLDVLLGVSQQKNTYRQIGAQGNGSVSDELRDLASVTTITNITGNQLIYSLASQFARINYKYKDKYLLTGTVRRDGSSRFAENNQYGVFPSVSAAWRIKNEEFLKDFQPISDLKIRASYGEVGNQNSAGYFQYLGQYGTGGPQSSAINVGYPFNKVYQAGIVLNSLPNPDLKWETSKQTDIGLDVSFLNGQLNFTGDYYRKESRDFLLPIPIPSQTGFTTATRNVGSIRNSGLELNLEYRESQKAFNYGIGLNLTTVNNKLLSLATGQNAINNLIGLGFPNVGNNTWVTFSQSKVGGQVGSFYGFKSAGIFQTQAEIDALNAGAGTGSFYQFVNTQPGDRKFQDISGPEGKPDGKVTDDDRTILGSPLPKFYTGLNLDAAFKQFDFNAFFYASVGNKIYNYAARTLETFGATQGGIGIENVSEEYYINRWTPTNPSNRFARVTKPDPNGNTGPSDVYVEDGSYLRLRNVQLGYTLSPELSKKLAMTKVRVYVSAQNLFTITKYSGLDPEIGQVADPDNGNRSVSASGIDVGTYPLSKYFTLGLNVTF